MALQGYESAEERRERLNSEGRHAVVRLPGQFLAYILEERITEIKKGLPPTALWDGWMIDEKTNELLLRVVHESFESRIFSDTYPELPITIGVHVCPEKPEVKFREFF
jgi:hypothetical protein